MLLDIIWKSLRKLLSQRLYDFISYEIFGRKMNYEKIETYFQIVKHYQSQGLNFNKDIVLEVGCGKQLYTALFVLAAGAKKVVLVEPRLVFSQALLEKTLKDLRKNYPETFQLFSEETVRGKIEAYKDISQIPDNFSRKVDVIYSYTVLEHVSNLPSYFKNAFRLTSENGVVYQLVDLSDHTYQLLAKFSFLRPIAGRRALYHLRYSQFLFNLINDSKCYMNRKLLPEYLSIAEENGFQVNKLTMENYDGKINIHPDLLKNQPQYDPKHLKITNFSLTLRKRCF